LRFGGNVMKDVKQLTVAAGKTATFEMKLQRTSFLVKNFTEGKIKVFLGENKTYSVIDAGCFEHVFNNIPNGRLIPEATNQVKVTADVEGLVEVASVD